METIINFFDKYIRKDINDIKFMILIDSFTKLKYYWTYYLRYLTINDYTLWSQIIMFSPNTLLKAFMISQS